MDIRRILLWGLALAVSGSPVSFMTASRTSSPAMAGSIDDAETFKPNDASSFFNTELVQQQPAHRSPPLPPPPPPPPSGTGKGRTSESAREKPRILKGITRAQLKPIERALARGSSVYIGPVGVDYETAAIAEADVDGDGVAETVVVHTQHQATHSEPRPPLMLSILSQQGNRYVVRMSISLVGSVLFNVDTNEGLLPLVIHDITGDGKPKIVLAPGPSASLGGWLEAYDVHGAKFRRLVHINGRYFSLRGGGPDKAISIATRWMEEDDETIYQWNGTEFQRVSAIR